MTIDEIAQALTRLAVELHNISANLNNAAPLVAPVQPPTSNKDNLAGLLGTHLPSVPPSSGGIPNDVMARYQHDIQVYSNAIRSLGPMGLASLHLVTPNLNDYRRDHNYQWSGHAILANAHLGHNPRPL